jgi:hypothetical protein
MPGGARRAHGYRGGHGHTRYPGSGVCSIFMPVPSRGLPIRAAFQKYRHATIAMIDGRKPVRSVAGGLDAILAVP